METINNVVTATSKAVFGDGSDKKEPVSGAAGDVSKGEPYDAGNLDPEDQKRFETLPTPTPGTETKNPLQVNDDPVAAATTSDEPEPKGDTSAGQTDPKPKPTDTTDHPEEATGADGEALKGPGPKPVAVLAREHGGDAGAAGKEQATEEKKEDGEEKTDDSKEKGTGEQVVHASGLAADGGDFDAANPGAGREADRLMGEKGIDHGEKDGGKSGSGSTPGKKSLKDRLKAKFHKS